MTITVGELARLVEIAFKEASQICRQVLRIPVPIPRAEKPLILLPTGCSQRKAKDASTKGAQRSDMEPDDSDLDDLDTDSEEEFDELETPTDGGQVGFCEQSQPYHAGCGIVFRFGLCRGGS